MEFKDRLKYLRKSSLMTQEELASKIHVTKATISNYEKGKAEPDFQTLLQLTSALNTSTDFLLGHKAGQKLSFDISGLTKDDELFFEEIGSLLLKMLKDKG